MHPENAVLRVAAIQRSCADDGPGIRTTVFLQGCPLKCPWCHNPEMRPQGPLVSFKPASCLGCGACSFEARPGHCRRNPTAPCTACGTCAAQCPGGALTLLGRGMSPADIMEIVARDKFYYDCTGGGLTLSGGEPLAQPHGAKALLELARQQGVGTAVETSAAVPQAVIDSLLDCVQCWMVDIKASRDNYRKLTGADPELVWSNLLFLSKAKANIVIRVPMVDGQNVDDGLLNLLREVRALHGVRKIDLLPFHDMGRGKAAMAGLQEAQWNTMAPPKKDLLEKWRSILA